MIGDDGSPDAEAEGSEPTGLEIALEGELGAESAAAEEFEPGTAGLTLDTAELLFDTPGLGCSAAELLSDTAGFPPATPELPACVGWLAAWV